MSRTEDFVQLKLKFVDDVQERYESIRPIVLFEDVSIEKRAAEIRSNTQTIRKRIKRFKKFGMLGLFDFRHFPERVKKWDVPQDVINEIFNLLSIYPNFKPGEIARIVFRKLGYKLSSYKVETIIEENPFPLQYQLPQIPSDPYQMRIEVVKLFYQGWKVKTISKFFGKSRQYIYDLIHSFEKENFAGLITKSKTPREPCRKIFLPIISRVYQLQKENPSLGRFRIWALLKKKLQEDGIFLQISKCSVGRIIALNKKLYPELNKLNEFRDNKVKKMPFKAKHRHQYWFIDIRYLAKIDDKWVYSLCVLEGFSRTILSGMVSPFQDLWAILMVLYTAILRFGIPDTIVSDNGAVFTSDTFQYICRRLNIRHEPIEKGKPWENLIEAFFGIQARMMDYKIKDVKNLEGVKRIHERFLHDYNTTDHWALQGRRDKRTVPTEVLSWVKGREISEKELHKVFYQYMFPRKTNLYGFIRLHNFYFYVEDGLPKSQVCVWIYQNNLKVEHQNEILIEYPCIYEEKKRKLTELINEPKFYQSKFSSKQLKLFEFGKFKIKRLERRKRRKPKETISTVQQLILFEKVA